MKTKIEKWIPQAPAARGLYDPRFEHDACGVGMVCHLKGEKSHRIIADGLKILVNLTHRGACGCDETTGDGAGIRQQARSVTNFELFPKPAEERPDHQP
jgi:glutamate synthase domain-containing protein 1